MKRREEGYCLVSQQIRDKIRKGDIKVNQSNLLLNADGFFEDLNLESRVQPSSFEPTIGDEVRILDKEEQSIFGPSKPDEEVRRALLRLPKRQRPKINISGGFELKRGFTYLVPLEEKITLHYGERVKSSPKSSTGRLFPLVRMVSDSNLDFDEIHYQCKTDEPLQTWLLVQPTAFNKIVHPGLSLNQLRFFNGLDVSLSQKEILEEFKKNPLLCLKKDKKEAPIVTDDGLQIKLDLSGEHTSGIVALRARQNPMPIDLSKTNFYNAEEFFEPVKINRNGKIKLYGGESYLIASKGKLNIPPHLSCELRRHYGSGMRGKRHEAGFVDPGFKGDLVFEVCINETGGITLDPNDERQASALEFFRTNQIPDKLYGEKKTQSHYQGQLGPRVSKHFKKFDFKIAARDYRKLDREVLVHDAKILNGFRKTREGFELLGVGTAKKLKKEINNKGFFQSRYDCETDEEILQVIPYVLLFGQDKEIFAYVRAANIRDFGEERLFGQHSIGFGGHISKEDGPKYIEKCVKREVMEEEIKIKGEYSPPKLIGTLMSYNPPVDRVHFGLIYTMHIRGTVEAKETSITAIGMQSFDEMTQNSDRFESWSKILIPHLSDFYKK